MCNGSQFTFEKISTINNSVKVTMFRGGINFEKKCSGCKKNTQFCRVILVVREGIFFRKGTVFIYGKMQRAREESSLSCASLDSTLQ